MINKKELLIICLIMATAILNFSCSGVVAGGDEVRKAILQIEDAKEAAEALKKAAKTEREIEEAEKFKRAITAIESEVKDVGEGGTRRAISDERLAKEIEKLGKTQAEIDSKSRTMEIVLGSLNKFENPYSRVPNSSPKRPFESVSLFEVLPSNNKEFRLVYRRNPTAVESRSIKGSADKYETLVKSKRFNSTQKGLSKESFRNHLKETDAETVFTVGHNQSGEFYFLNGEGLTLNEMGALCKEQKKRCIFLSCEAKKYSPDALGANTLLTHDEGNNIVAETVDFLKKADSELQSLEDTAILHNKNPYKVRDDFIDKGIQNIINSSERNIRIRRRVELTLEASAAVGTGGLIIIVLDRE
jgi:hypothetical protein